MNMPAANLIALAIFGAVFAAIVTFAVRLNPPQRGRHVPPADPADRDDPHGEKYEQAQS